MENRNAMINNNFSPLFLGSTCLFGDVVTSPDIIQLAHKSGLSTFIGSAGLQENIEQNVSSTLQCAITVQCSDCSPHYMRNVTLDSCLSNKDIGSVPSDHYMISIIFQVAVEKLSSQIHWTFKLVSSYHKCCIAHACTNG